METFYPGYYHKFKCIADKCKHNCCIGWEIDIDEDSYNKYKDVRSDFGKKLMSGINTDSEPYFCLKENERCAFLNDDNLCDIIINLGEDYLCHICNMHPRFVNYFSEREEIGLGLCCEAAANIIFSEKKRTIFVSDGKRGSCNAEENEFFSARDEIFSIIQNRDLHIKDRINCLCEKYNIDIPFDDYLYWADILGNLERLDSNWDLMLKSLADIQNIPNEFFNDKWAIFGEQLLVYFIYRHLADGMYDGIAERIAFAILSYTIIIAICASSKQNITDVARQYSSEIEYSDENMDKLLDILSQFFINNPLLFN